MAMLHLTAAAMAFLHLRVAVTVTALLPETLMG
jgi:hypothetical protein